MSTDRHRAPACALLLAAVACQSPATDSAATASPPAAASAAAAVEPGWRWSMERVLETVQAVRAGRSLAPAAWPDGGRVAVLLSFDVDNETVSLRFGQPTIGDLSQGEYGGRAALGRVVAALDRHAIPATFFIPAVSLRLTPQMAEVIGASGRHEFAVHGWIHEMNTEMPAEIEREMVQRAMRELEEMTGYTPVGYRAPSWNFSPNTLSIIRELGFLYDSSLMSDDSPYEIMAGGQATGIIELPVEWILDDAPLLNPRGNSFTPPRELLQVWKDEFDRAYEERGMFLLTMHPHVIGHRSRVLVLEQLIDHMRSKPGVWFGTHRAAAEHVRPVSAPPGT